MHTTIAEGFGDLGITISNTQIAEVEKLVVHFTLRKTHPLTFSGPYLGADPIAFTSSDYTALFDVFKIHQKDVELVIRNIPAIDRNFNVISDPFNLLAIWLCHLAPIYIKDKRICRDFMMNILRYYHYRIFCSLVNNFFRHGTNRGIMEATIASLNNKSDIIRLGSWNKIIESHVERMVDSHDRFLKVIIDGSPDDLFLRIISDSQTAIRAKVKTVANSYYEAYSAGDSIGSFSSISENDDGEKILAQTASVVDSATAAMVAEILNPNMFINDVSVNDVAQIFSTISPRMLKTALLKINEVAVLQTSNKLFDKVKTDKEGTLYIGVRVLIIEIIRSMIRICRLRKINLGSRAKVFDEMRKIYSSSRNMDPDILAVKRSISILVDEFNITTNEASKSALRLGVIYYILYRTIGKMKV